MLQDSMTTDPTLKELKEIAQAAREGPWDTGYDGGLVLGGDGCWLCDCADDAGAHIAAFDPPTCKDLIAQVEKLEAALQAMLDTHRVDDGVSHATEGWMRARGMAVVALRDHRDEPATDGTAKEGAGQ